MKKVFIYSVDVTLVLLVLMSIIFIIENTSIIILPFLLIALIKTGVYYLNSRCDYFQSSI